MTTAERLTNALEAALTTARAEYRNAVLELASREAGKEISSGREAADVDHIHHARTRVIAFEAACEELRRMVDEGVALSNDG